MMNPKTKASRGSSARSWRRIFWRRQRAHDPMLVFNMSIFNSGSSWQEIFSAFKARENVG
jgi:hypothetical protein